MIEKIRARANEWPVTVYLFRVPRFACALLVSVLRSSRPSSTSALLCSALVFCVLLGPVCRTVEQPDPMHETAQPVGPDETAQIGAFRQTDRFV